MKRGGDLAIVALAGITAVPAGLLIALLIRWTTGGPALSRRSVLGLHGRGFELLTFRTTRRPGAPDGPAAPGTTRIGALLRRTGLDQLPQLWNVVRGEMSVVGPRPVAPGEAARSAAGRLAVRPGLTGWAQVGGRQGVGRAGRLELDLWYVRHRSLRLDLRILAMTVNPLPRPAVPAAPVAVPVPPAPRPPAAAPPGPAEGAGPRR